MGQAEVVLPLDARLFDSDLYGWCLLRHTPLLQLASDRREVQWPPLPPPFRLLIYAQITSPQEAKWSYRMKWIPNLLTALRIVCSSLIFIAPVYTNGFYLLYVVCGITDFLDGRLARRLHAASKSGASLDNIADYSLIASTILKVLPTLKIKAWALIWGICMLAAHISSSIIAWMKFRRIIVLHTLANKLLGGVVYAIPLLAGLGNHTLLISIVCVFMCFSVPEEIYLLVTAKQLEPDIRGVFFNNSNIHRGYAEPVDSSGIPLGS